MNQRRHAWPYGSLWRSIEEYLAANGGRFAFVRLIYSGGADTDEPTHIEFGLIDPDAQVRVTEFPNTALRARDGVGLSAAQARRVQADPSR